MTLSELTCSEDVAVHKSADDDVRYAVEFEIVFAGVEVGGRAPDVIW